MPSSQRAPALDRGYFALVQAQSFAKGRDVVLGAARVHERAPASTSEVLAAGPPFRPR